MPELDIDTLELLRRMGVALAAGLIIGLERGWHDRALEEGQRIAGVRTFGVIGLFGAGAAMLAEAFGGLVLAAAFVALGALLTVGHWRATADRRDFGITTLCVALVTFALGALAARGELVAAATGAVVVSLLLGIKAELHDSLRKLDRAELFATLRLLLITVVILPILPDQGYGPWQVLNPYRIWLMVVLIAGISYIGHFAVRLTGTRRGILATGLLGGMASSTAVTLNFGRLAKGNPRAGQPLAAGVVAASSMMFPRMLIILVAVAPDLAARLVWPLAFASVAGLSIVAWWSRSGGDRPEPTEDGGAPVTRNPLDLRMALQFGALLVAIMLVARGAREWIGEEGVYAVAALSGIADVDAILLSLASMTGQGGISPVTAGLGILIAGAVNTAIKPILFSFAGGHRNALRIVAGLGSVLVAGAAGLWVGTAAAP